MTDITQIPARLPEAYTRKANFTDDYVNDPAKPVTPQKVDAEFNAIVRVLQDTQARAALIQRDDGELQNESVARETLKPEVFAQLEALEAAASDSANAAAASATAAAASAQAAADDAAATAADRLATAADALATAADAVATADDRLAAQASADAAAASAQAAADDAAATAADRLATAADALATAADRTATAADAVATAADRAVIEALSAQFRGTYYGELAADPATDPLGNPPTPGDLYFNSTTATLRLFDGVAWNLASVDPSTLGTASTYNVGTASDQIPTNGDLGSASTYNVGTASDQIPTNGDLGSASTYNVGTASDQIPTNGDLGTAATKDVATEAEALAGTADVLVTAEQARAVIAQDAPSKTGAGVSGDWDINITGSAAKWTTARTITLGDTGKSVDGSDNVSWTRAEMGVPRMTTSTSVGIENAESCIGYVSNSLFGQADGALYSQVYSEVWKHQIQGDYRTGQIGVRGKSNGVWQPWRTVLDSGNFNNYSHPVGTTYIQFPGYAAPSALFGGTWSQIFNTEGVFFRTEGGNASAFGGGIQSAAMQNFTGSLGGVQLQGTTVSDTTNGVIRFQRSGGGNSSGSSSYGTLSIDASRQVSTASETRPINRTIRVWVRIA